jgi:hypothetical protein
MRILFSLLMAAQLFIKVDISYLVFLLLLHPENLDQQLLSVASLTMARYNFVERLPLELTAMIVSFAVAGASMFTLAYPRPRVFLALLLTCRTLSELSKNTFFNTNPLHLYVNGSTWSCRGERKGGTPGYHLYTPWLHSNDPQYVWRIDGPAEMLARRIPWHRFERIEIHLHPELDYTCGRQDVVEHMDQIVMQSRTVSSGIRDNWLRNKNTTTQFSIKLHNTCPFHYTLSTTPRNLGCHNLLPTWSQLAVSNVLQPWRWVRGHHASLNFAASLADLVTLPEVAYVLPADLYTGGVRSAFAGEASLKASLNSVWAGNNCNSTEFGVAGHHLPSWCLDCWASQDSHEDFESDLRLVYDPHIPAIPPSQPRPLPNWVSECINTPLARHDVLSPYSDEVSVLKSRADALHNEVVSSAFRDSGTPIAEALLIEYQILETSLVKMELELYFCQQTKERM